jgi:predicted rRNA methylase YqxC with S4 and FtsJ domains
MEQNGAAMAMVKPKFEFVKHSVEAVEAMDFWRNA